MNKYHKVTMNKFKDIRMKEFLFVLLLLIVFTIVGTLETRPSDVDVKDQIKDYIEHCGIKHSDIVFKQAILETGHFQSRLFTDDNNVFGMKLAKNRPTTAIGVNGNGSAIYLTWQHSVIDYMIWQNRQPVS